MFRLMSTFSIAFEYVLVFHFTEYFFGILFQSSLSISICILDKLDFDIELK